MSRNASPAAAPALVLPSHRDLFYGGAWHPPKLGKYVASTSPSTQEVLGSVAEAR